MDADQLKQTISSGFKESDFSLDCLSLQTDAINQIAADFFPNNQIKLTSASLEDQSQHKNLIIVKGNGVDHPFNNLPCELQFYPIGSEVAFKFIATVGKDWTLAKGFPPFKKTIIANLFFSESPVAIIILCSHQDANNSIGMRLEGSVDLNSISMGLAAFLKLPHLPLSGNIKLKENGSKFHQIDLASKEISYLDLGIATVEKLKLNLTNRLGYDSLRKKYYAIPYLQLSTEIPFAARGKKHRLPIAVQVSNFDSDMRFSADLTDSIDAALDELKSLTNNVGMEELFPEDNFHLGDVIKLNDFYFEFNPKYEYKIKEIGLQITNASPWKILHLEHSKKDLVVQNLTFDFSIFDPFNPTAAGRKLFYLSGEIALGKASENPGTIIVNTRYPDWFIQGYLKEGTYLNLAELLQEFLGSEVSVPEMEVVFLDFELSSGLYSLTVDVEGYWPISTGEINLAIEEVGFSITHTADQGTQATLKGMFRIAEVDILIIADHPALPNAGWSFSGNTGQGQEIMIGALLDDLGRFFGAVEAPASIRDFTIKNLGVSFNTESKDFTFTCEGVLPLPDTAMVLEAVIDIEIKHQHDNEQDSTYTKRFSGYLDVNGLRFALVFEDSVGTGDVVTKTFIAAFNDQDGRKIEIDEVLKKIFPPALPTDQPVKTGLSIGINDAVIAFENKKDKGKNPVSNYLLGIDIETGLNLSALDLPDLPLVKTLLPPEQSLKLALQLFYAKSQFKIEDVDHFNGLMTQGLKLPHKEINDGLGFVALVRVGQDVKPLSLPIGVDSKNGKGLVDASGKSQPDVVTANSPETSADVRTADNTQWIKIQKTFGPIHLERVGVGYQNSNIKCLLDASLTAAGLTLSLDGLGAEFALTDIAKKDLKPSFHLDGMGIDFKNGSLEIGGTFLKQLITPATVPGQPAAAPYTSYAGLAIIRTSKLSLSAIGSYTQLSGHDPSLFVYAVANYPLGGPPFFFVTGFAAGFGYNRALTLPPIDQVASFPLVAEAVQDGGPKSLPTDKKEQQSAFSAKLRELENYLSPASGEIFIAAGVKFNSFKQIDSFALLILKFGRHFEIDLLGFSTMTAPPPKLDKAPSTQPEKNKAVAPLAQAQLVLKASFVPDEGLLAVRAQLTPNSYIFSKDCHVSGGFAFYSWFNPHPNAGDFVLTLGGYHPKFEAPQHYPQVPRLAVNWQVSAELHVKADAYFALTGSALMAGGHLQAVYQHDKLKAWFNAGADFIVAWQPYHYDAEIYIDIGVSYTFEIFGNHTLSVDLGADLHLWGPEFCGQATVHWSIISFTVRFGEDSPQQLKPIDWITFKTAFLPNENQICTVGVQQGLIRQITAENKGVDVWVVNAKEMVLMVNTVVPINSIENLSSYLQLTDLFAGNVNKPAIASMGLKDEDLESTLSITITREGSQAVKNGAFQLTPCRKAMPAGLWGKPQFSEADSTCLKKPDLNGPQLVENMLVGYEIRPANKIQQSDNEIESNVNVLQDDGAKLVKIQEEWQDLDLVGLRGELAWDAAKKIVNKRDKQIELFSALGLVDPIIDFSEPVNRDFFESA